MGNCVHWLHPSATRVLPRCTCPTRRPLVVHDTGNMSIRGAANTLDHSESSRGYTSVRSISHRTDIHVSSGPLEPNSAHTGVDIYRSDMVLPWLRVRDNAVSPRTMVRLGGNLRRPLNAPGNQILALPNETAQLCDSKPSNPIL